jgi:hypothetical protein
MNLATLAFAAAATIVPPQPASFETVNLRMTVDSCTFVPGTIRVTMVSNVIRVTELFNNLLRTRHAAVVDVKLGALPARRPTRVQVLPAISSLTSRLEDLAFQVRDPSSPPASCAAARGLHGPLGTTRSNRGPGACRSSRARRT